MAPAENAKHETIQGPDKRSSLELEEVVRASEAAMEKYRREMARLSRELESADVVAARIAVPALKEKVAAGEKALSEANYRIARLMRVFDMLGVDRPDKDAPMQRFASDEFLLDLKQQVAEKVGIVDGESPRRAETAKLAADGNKPPSEFTEVCPLATTHVAQSAPMDGTDGSPVRELDCLRLLIGAASVKLDKSGERVIVTMLNQTLNRSICFSVAWDSTHMSYKPIAIDIPQASCPIFLKDEIDFELTQCPNFIRQVLTCVYTNDPPASVAENA